MPTAFDVFWPSPLGIPGGRLHTGRLVPQFSGFRHRRFTASQSVVQSAQHSPNTSTSSFSIETRDIIRGPTSGTRRDEISIASLFPPHLPRLAHSPLPVFSQVTYHIKVRGRMRHVGSYSRSRATLGWILCFHFVFSCKPLNPQRGKMTPPHFLIPGGNRPHAFSRTPGSQRSAASVLPEAASQVGSWCA